jgi:hypothetical protein
MVDPSWRALGQSDLGHAALTNSKPCSTMKLKRMFGPPDAAGQVEFGAPWGRLLKAISLGMTALLLAIAATALSRPGTSPAVGVAVTATVVGLLLACALFTIRGYVLTPDALWIRRLLWFDRVRLEGLRDVIADSQAIRWSLRLWGNGGLFSFSGWFRNRRLGFYRMFATDLRKVVILDFGNRRIAVTPDDPARFAHCLKTRIASA